MAIKDIVFDNDSLLFINELDEGTLGNPSDIVTDDSAISESGVSYPDMTEIVEAIWEYGNRTLTS